jgi:hypothetical protein
MEHAGADDQVEGARRLADAFDGESMEFEVLQIILALKIARVAQTRFAYVDSRDPGARLAKRIPRRLRRAAAGKNENPHDVRQ